MRPAIVSVPDRLGPLVAAKVKFTVPFPEPLAPDVMVIHETLRAAVQAQPAPPVTATEALPPDEGTDRVSGEMPNAQPFPCVTVTVWFATTSVPDRGGPLAAATANVTDPGPLPLAPDVIVIHGSGLDALQAQPAAAVTVTVREPPVGSASCVSGATSKLQPGDCVTARACPAIVTVPLRVGPVVAATFRVTLPGPVPPGVAGVIQSASLEAVHGQPAPAVTVTACDPPDAPTE